MAHPTPASHTIPLSWARQFGLNAQSVLPPPVLETQSQGCPPSRWQIKIAQLVDEWSGTCEKAKEG